MKDSTIRVLQALTLFCVAVTGLFLNIVVSLVFYKRPALRSSSNRFVLSLMMANIFSVLGLVPTVLYLFSKSNFDCLAHIGSSLFILVVTASVFSILVIAIDRYNAVLSPLHYSMTITSQRNKETIAGIWCVSVLLSTPPLLGVFSSRLPHPESEVLRLPYVTVLFTFGFVIPLFTLIWVYARMYIAAHKNSERTRRQSIQANAGNDCSRGGSIETQFPPIITTLDFIRTAKPPMLSQLHKRRYSNATFSAILFREEGKAVKTAVMVIASFVFCWGPFFVVLLLLTFEILETLSHTILFTGVFPVVVNSTLSPFIYVFRNELARNEAVRLIYWWKKIGLYEGNVLQQANREMKLKTADGIQIRHQSSSNYDSMSVQSFQLPLNYSVECKQCTEPTHTPVADFVATYEVVSLKGEPKNNAEVKFSESKTKGESVTFRLAFLPQRRCQTCIRQNSDSSSGSAHPLLKDTEPLTPVHTNKRHDIVKISSVDESQLLKGKLCDSPKQSLLRYNKDQTIEEMEEHANSDTALKPLESKIEIDYWSDKNESIRPNYSGSTEYNEKEKLESNPLTNNSCTTSNTKTYVPKRLRHKLQRLLAVEDEEGFTKSKISTKFNPYGFG